MPSRLKHTRKSRPLRCRCRTAIGTPCKKPVQPGTLFCPEHQFCPHTPLSGDEPLFRPDRYNKNPLVQKTHNCWAYGMNVLDPAQLTQCLNKGKDCQLMYHQPGGTQHMASQLRSAAGRSCPTVERLMRTDVPDIRRTTYKARCPRGSRKIAMVVPPG